MITTLLALLLNTALPLPAITPGETDPRLTEAVLLAPHFTTAKYRPSTSKTGPMKIQAFKLYGIDPTPANLKAYELDHLISLELGGATTLKNLWPEPWNVNVGGYDEGAHTKDRAENALRKAVVLRKISLSDAQKMIASDWTVAYKKFVAPELPKFVGAK